MRGSAPCINLEDVPNAEGKSINSILVEYECTKGYHFLRGSATTRKCQSDGTWQPDPPKCVGKLEDYIILSNIKSGIIQILI